MRHNPAARATESESDMVPAPAAPAARRVKPAQPAGRNSARKRAYRVRSRARSHGRKDWAGISGSMRGENRLVRKRIMVRVSSALEPKKHSIYLFI